MSKSCMYYCIEENRSDQSRGLELYRHYAINYTRSRFDRRFECHFSFSILSYGAICFHLHVQCFFFVFFNFPPDQFLGSGIQFPANGPPWTVRSIRSIRVFHFPSCSSRYGALEYPYRRSSSTRGTNHFYSNEPNRNPRKNRVCIIQQIKLKKEIKKKKLLLSPAFGPYR